MADRTGVPEEAGAAPPAEADARALPAWEAFVELDGVLSESASGAEERIAYQARHPAAR
ncbi:hypothetical protein J0910_03760 [Nocardiopsis sp. CNT-189]|uniref:hypothetical protein n=1 Tax=Nocardiopsis oceanisediminis TaxID=2816862 RepID=UPI003B317C67